MCLQVSTFIFFLLWRNLALKKSILECYVTRHENFGPTCFSKSHGMRILECYVKEVARLLQLKIQIHCTIIYSMCNHGKVPHIWDCNISVIINMIFIFHRKNVTHTSYESSHQYWNCVCVCVCEREREREREGEIFGLCMFFW